MTEIWCHPSTVANAVGQEPEGQRGWLAQGGPSAALATSLGSRRRDAAGVAPPGQQQPQRVAG